MHKRAKITVRAISQANQWCQTPVCRNPQFLARFHLRPVENRLQNLTHLPQLRLVSRHHRTIPHYSHSAMAKEKTTEARRRRSLRTFIATPYGFLGFGVGH